MTTATEPSFAPPGPGRWSQDVVHHPGGVTTFVGAVLPAAQRAGFAAAFERYGIPLAGMEVQLVNGFVYTRMAPMIEAGQRPPPPWIVRLGPWLHPGLRARRRAATRAVAGRIWLDDLATWTSTDRPRLRAALVDLGGAELAVRSDDELGGLVGEAAALVAETAYAHFRYDGAYLAALGSLLGAEMAVGHDPSVVVAALVDASRATRAPDTVRAELVAALDGDEVVTLPEVRAHSLAAEQALDWFLTEFGNRVVHRFDIDARTLVELPSLVVELATKTPRDTEGGGDGGRGPFVPADKILWQDTEAVLGLRDDTAGHLQWALGVARRTALEAGRRLVARRVFARPEDAGLFEPDELRAVLVDADPGLTDDVERRRVESAARRHLDAPPFLGDEPPPPSPDLLPEPQRRMVTGIVAYGALHFAAGSAPLSGFGIGDAPVTGRAVVVGRDDQALDTFAPGDILIAPMTTPAHNTIAALVGAIVTDNGGLLSHAAIIAREFAVPAVIGTTTATRVVKTGDRVTVDPVSGAVHRHIEGDNNR